MKYLILQHPGHNRVYYNVADKLALAELKLASHRLSADCTNVDIVEIKGIRYLSIKTESELSKDDLQVLSRLSFVFAIFRLDKLCSEDCLLPIRQETYEYIDSKISSLLKYAGKTNELFTKMMINVALLSSDFDYIDKITLLDPVAGKGTTLFEASVYGFDAYGIELEPKSVHEATLFFRKYLQTERIKHQQTKQQVYGKGKADAINIEKYEYANSKEAFKSADSIKTLGMVCGNSQDAHKYFKKELFNLIVGDLPYGIAHGNVKGQKAGSKTRNPSDMLNDCLPEWRKVLKKGGVCVVAWNSFIVSRQRLSDTFEQHGFEVLSDEPYNEFEHMVDKSIKRDIVVARKR